MMPIDSPPAQRVTHWVSALRARWHARSGVWLCRSSLQAPACGVVASHQTPERTRHQARPTAVSRFKSWPKFLVILLVASLQCVAPLIHAHTNSAADHHEYSHSEGSAPALHPVLGEDHQHGETIGVAKEYKRDYTLVFFAAATLLPTPQLFQATSLAPDRVQPLPPPVNRHTRPSPQAP